MLSSIFGDLRYAARSLKRSPGFAAAAIVTIALGVGMNAGIFTVLNAVLFRDVPAPDAHELVSIYQTVQGGRGYIAAGDRPFSMSEYVAYRDRAETLAGVLAHANAPQAMLGGDSPREVLGKIVSCNYFSVLQQLPALGRAFTEQDCEPGADPVIVIDHGLWTSAFEADPNVVGRTVALNRQFFTIVGVAAEGTYSGAPFTGGYIAPLGVEPLLRPDGLRLTRDELLWLNLMGRRRADVDLDTVRAELRVIAAQIDAEDPGRSTILAVDRAKATEILGDRAAVAAVVLMAPFAFILLIACANVANLLLARGTTRGREIAIRSSLGASRARVVRQLLTESMLISAAGGIVGSWVAIQCFDALVSIVLPVMLPPDLPISIVLDVSPDLRVLAFAIAVTFATGLLFGLAPALNVTKPDLNAVIKQDSAGAGGHRGGGRLRGALVGVQVALCMVLMIGAGLLSRGLYHTYAVDPGFEYRDVSYLSLESWLDAYDAAELDALRPRVQNEVEALPGIEAAAYANQRPLALDDSPMSIRLPEEPEAQARPAQSNAVGPDYFSVLGLPILRGRAFTQADMAGGGAARPVILSAATARSLWPDADPIGRTLLSEDAVLQVVGVAADAQTSSLGRIDPYYVYVPGGGAVLLIKSRVDFGATASAVRAAVRRVDPTLVAEVRTLESTLGYWRGLSGAVTGIGAGLGVLALTLAGVGIYGVVAYAVRRRYREIGIRMALGARARDVLAMILRQTLRPVVIGAAIGGAAAVLLSGALSSLLFGVSPADPLGIGGAALLVLGLALTAGVMAARHATRAEPTAVLRHE